MKKKKENNLIKNLIIFTFAIMVLMVPAKEAQASTKSDAENVLKYFQEGNIS